MNPSIFALENIENQLGHWKNQFQHGSIAYTDSGNKFRGLIAQHFGDASEKVYGVYVIRQMDTGAILYIGKGGTVSSDGQIKGQDIAGRLRNVRGDDVGADRWFRELLLEMGPLTVEYVIVDPPIAPAYVEASLLQAYLVEHKQLPPKNRTL